MLRPLKNQSTILKLQLKYFRMGKKNEKPHEPQWHPRWHSGLGSLDIPSTPADSTLLTISSIKLVSRYALQHTQPLWPKPQQRPQWDKLLVVQSTKLVRYSLYSLHDQCTTVLTVTWPHWEPQNWLIKTNKRPLASEASTTSSDHSEEFSVTYFLHFLLIKFRANL